MITFFRNQFENNFSEIEEHMASGYSNSFDTLHGNINYIKFTI